MKRLGIREENEDVIIQNYNKFYYILFYYLREEGEKKILDKFSFIPNEKREYRILKDIFCNKDIDNDIKNILSYLDKNNKFQEILIYQKIKLSINHQQKSLEDIALEIDKLIKKKFTQIDNFFEVQKELNIEDNFKIACKKLINEWFAKNIDKKDKFDFVNSHIPEIFNKIICEGKFQEKLNEILIKSPDKFYKILSNNQPLILHNDNSFDLDENEISLINSLNSTRNISIMNNDNNNNIFNNHQNNANNNYVHANNNYIRPNYNYNNANNNYVNSLPESLKKYYLAQAYVYEDLINSNLFKQIDWKNKANENEEAYEVTLMNLNKYKIKKYTFHYDFRVTTNENEIFNIKVKDLSDEDYNYLKVKFTTEEWKSFNNEQSISILALVNLRFNNNPEISYTQKIDLNDII